MGQAVVVVDAFTDRPFAGNPAAVCVMAGPADEGWMRDVAREMNLSETAFLHPEADGYRLRWFTPATEVKLCGHATLASAHVLWESGRLPQDAVARFHTHSGLLTARRPSGPASGGAGWIALDFPARPVSEGPAPAGLAAALGVEPRFVGRSELADLLVELASADAVRSLAPDIRALGRLSGVRGVMVTAAGGGAPYDFVSRFFAPGAGVDEDPVTGSAHCSLGPFWAERLGRTELLAHQASARGGVVRVVCRGDRVDLVGQAVTVWRGEIIGSG
jgi:PhzF family phenazine biosynthesis protein